MPKQKPRFFKPGISGGRFYVSRKREKKNGDIVKLSDFEIGPTGVSVTDKELLERLDEHPLKGHRFGFFEVKSLAKPKVIANQPTDPEEEIIPESSKEEKALTVNDLSIPKTKEYIENNNLSDQEIVDFTSNDEENREGIQTIHDAAKERLKEAAGSDGSDGSQTVVKEDITNINQLKDYVQDQEGVDGRKLTTPDKVLAAAQQLDPPHEFPNLNVGG